MAERPGSGRAGGGGKRERAAGVRAVGRSSRTVKGSGCPKVRMTPASSAAGGAVGRVGAAVGRDLALQRAVGARDPHVAARVQVDEARGLRARGEQEEQQQ